MGQYYGEHRRLSRSAPVAGERGAHSKIEHHAYDKQQRECDNGRDPTGAYTLFRSGLAHTRAPPCSVTLVYIPLAVVSREASAQR